MFLFDTLGGTAVARPIIVLEFNELCPHLVEKWIEAGRLPGFAALKAESSCFVTEADEADPVNLEPWIQWYSLHTGLPFKEHGVFHLTDGPKAQHLDIWRHLNNQGLKVASFGSMNTRKFTFPDATYLPDPWCTTESAHPSRYETFRKFVQQEVQEHTRSNTSQSLTQRARIAFDLKALGVKMSTFAKIAAQLSAEKFGLAEKWKRVVFLDWLQFDIFEKEMRRNRPDFATFFINSTAHYQHAYWRYMEPEAFVYRPTDKQIQRNGGAVFYGYRNMDKLITRSRRLAHKIGARVVLATALSQQPFLKWEEIGGQRFYRPVSIDNLLKKCDVPATCIEPVMTHQYLIRFDSTEDCKAAAEKLKKVVMDGAPILQVNSSDNTSLYVGCQLRKEVCTNKKITFPDRDVVSFWNHFYLIQETKSGCHHADGLFWIQRGEKLSNANAARMSILDVFPVLCDALEVPTPVALRDWQKQGQGGLKKNASQAAR